MWDNSIEPLSNIRETNDRIVISVDLPFVNSKDQIEIYVYGDLIEIVANASKSIKWRRGISAGEAFETSQYEKRVRLPFTVTEDDIKATFKNGILLITVDKKNVKKRKVNVY
ncbi:MAG: Hsp20/alpha crystallin family protein [Nitrososphaeria archaeon]